MYVTCLCRGICGPFMHRQLHRLALHSTLHSTLELRDGTFSAVDFGTVDSGAGGRRTEHGFRMNRYIIRLQKKFQGERIRQR